MVCCSVAQSCPTLCDPMDCSQASLSFTIPQSLLKLMSIELMMPSSHLIVCHPFSSCPQSFPASGSFPMSPLFASGGQSIGVSAFSIAPFNEYSGLISFRIDWFALFSVQGTLKSLLFRVQDVYSGASLGSTPVERRRKQEWVKGEIKSCCKPSCLIQYHEELWG